MLTRRLRREESGFTLIELMVATVIGMVIILAAYGLADASVRSFTKTDNRIDVTQRGRLAIDAIGRPLRSQTCPVGASSTATNTIGSFVTATDTKAVFWADLGRNATSVRPADPSLDGFSYSNGTISELSYAGNVSTGAETTTSVVTNVSPFNSDNSSKTPTSTLFTYWKFNPAYDPTETDTSASDYPYYLPMSTPVADADLSDIVKVTVAFKAYPRKSNVNDKTSAVFSDQVNLRTADYAKAEAPAC
jgi:prepilin-type N-terminal cleavage/methylation domain-containing protein